MTPRYERHEALAAWHDVEDFVVADERAEARLADWDGEALEAWAVDDRPAGDNGDPF